ncbi:serine hydrolase domain-containing protein [Chondrinema litorale]|uniref:serine hydrolase domain-containing protein n=1 Tax=Chondrinema litorale TaxID=2994555 RepID=UPI002542C65E|nr:serine hydrolase domain-containing protein [Chondrinema litorale]UZR94482.1 serine hydrolase [Chondrinema litorale]
MDSLSAVLLVAENGDVKLHKAKGYKNFETNTNLEKNDVFELASVSKQFTATAIMMLEQDGKLSFDDYLQHYLPELPYEGVTIRQMLQHISGLPDYMVLFEEHWDKSKVAGNKEIIEYLVKYHPPVLFKPGEKYEYSNTGYVLLASVVEVVSGEDFVDFLQNRVFKTGGLDKTAIRSKEEKLKMADFAWGFIYDAEKQKYLAADSFPYTDYGTYLGDRKGPGRVSSTALDLLKWDQYLRSGSLLKDSTLIVAYTPAKLNDGSEYPYGFGWGVSDDDKYGKVARHNGSNPGYSTTFIRFLDSDRTLILLCNNQSPNFAKVVDELFKVVGEVNDEERILN